MSTPSSIVQTHALTFINSIYDAILIELEKRPFGRPEVTLQRIKSFDVTYNENQQKLGWHVSCCQVTYSWPGRNRDEAWRFTCVGKILGEIKTALELGHMITKRDIFYRDPILFNNQQVVDRYIDDIAYSCKVSRIELNVAASPHGLYAGLAEGDDKVHSINEERWEATVSLKHLKWILIVEKEATFKQLVEQKLQSDCSSGPGLIVTGRGYPDRATQCFVRALAQRIDPPIMVFGLFDADPDGLAILKCYRYGSRVTAPEVEHSEINIIWLGIKIHHVEEVDLLPLTVFDRAKAVAMLSKSMCLREIPHYGAHCGMLQHMLMLNVKAEIQALRGGSEALFGWLDVKMMYYQSQAGN